MWGSRLKPPLRMVIRKEQGSRAKILRDELFRNMTRDGGILLLGLGT